MSFAHSKKSAAEEELKKKKDEKVAEEFGALKLEDSGKQRPPAAPRRPSFSAQHFNSYKIPKALSLNLESDLDGNPKDGKVTRPPSSLNHRKW